MIETHGFINTKTVRNLWCAWQSCRKTATCMTAAGFPDSYALAVDDVHEGRRDCWSSCNAWSWHTPCTCNMLVSCLPEHDMVVCSQDVIWQINVCVWTTFDTYSFPCCHFVHDRNHAFACSNNTEWTDKFTSDQPTYIKKGKMPGGLKGLTMSPLRWEFYITCAYVILAIESMYSETKSQSHVLYQMWRSHRW